MNRRTNLILAAERLEEAIDVHCASGRGLSKKRRPMLKELLRYMVLQESPTELPSLGRPWRRVRTVVEYYGEVLPLNAYIMGTRGYDVRRMVTLGDLKASEVSYLAGLSRRTGISLGNLAEQASPSTLADVEAQFENLVAYLDERAVEDVLLAAMESYAVPAGRGRRYTEIYGVCFGSRRDKELLGRRHDKVRRILRISRVATQLRARGTASSVTRNDRSSQLHRHVAERFFEHLELLGDYHTHPYRSVADLKKHKGWQLSDADRDDVTHWVRQLEPEGQHPRLSLVVAIARGERTGSAIKPIADNCIEFSLRRHFIRIGAYRIRLDGTCDDEVKLTCPQLGVEGAFGEA